MLSKRLLLPDAKLMLLATVAMEIKEFEEAPEDEDDNEQEEDRDEDGFPFLTGDCDKTTEFLSSVSIQKDYNISDMGFFSHLADFTVC